MEQPPSRQEIIQVLSEFVRGEIEEDGEKYVVTVTRRESSIKLYAEFAEIDELSSILSGLEVNDETALYSDNGYEVIVREESGEPIRRLRDEKIEVRNDENGIIYELSPASNEYLVWLLKEIKNNLSPRDFRLGFYYHPRVDRFFEDQKKEAKLIEFISMMSVRFLTLKISSKKKTKPFTIF